MKPRSRLAVISSALKTSCSYSARILPWLKAPFPDNITFVDALLRVTRNKRR